MGLTPEAGLAEEANIGRKKGKILTQSGAGFAFEKRGVQRELRVGQAMANDLWPLRCGSGAVIQKVGVCVIKRKPSTEQRKWPRLPLAIPVFVRSREGDDKELLEFATALNISAGGALVAVRRSLPLSAQVLLEIPCAPMLDGAGLPPASRILKARTLRVVHVEGYYLVGLKFSHPLTNHNSERSFTRRKVSSSV